MQTVPKLVLNHGDWAEPKSRSNRQSLFLILTFCLETNHCKWFNLSAYDGVISVVLFVFIYQSAQSFHFLVESLMYHSTIFICNYTDLFFESTNWTLSGAEVVLFLTIYKSAQSFHFSVESLMYHSTIFICNYTYLFFESTNWTLSEVEELDC